MILIFELPDKEADFHGDKKNLIVTRGRQKSFFLINIIFWISSIYFLVLALTGWYTKYINFWIITAVSILILVYFLYLLL